MNEKIKITNMKIIINGYFLGKSKTGIGQYFSHILEIILQNKDHEWTIVVPEEFRESLDPELSTIIRDAIVLVQPFKKGDTLLTTLLWERFTFARYIPTRC